MVLQLCGPVFSEDPSGPFSYEEDICKLFFSLPLSFLPLTPFVTLATALVLLYRIQHSTIQLVTFPTRSRYRRTSPRSGNHSLLADRCIPNL